MSGLREFEKPADLASLTTWDLLTTFGWHRFEVCDRCLDDVPNTRAGFRRKPKKCACGYYDALKMTEPR